MPLPDERPRASVANLIGRFEKQTRKSDAPTNGQTPAPTVPGKLAFGKTPPTDSTPATSWVKKKESTPPAPVATEKVVISTAAPDNTPEAAPIDAGDAVSDEPFEPSRTSPTPVKPEEAKTTAPRNPPLKGPTLPSATTSSTKVMPTLLKPASKATKTSATPRPPPSTSSSSITPSASIKPSQTKHSAMPLSASTSSLNKSKSTPTLKPARPSTTTSPLKKDPHPPLPTLKPQHTGTSTTSTSRRMVASNSSSAPARAKTPQTTTRPKASGGLYAPTASSLAKLKAAESAAASPGPKKAAAPPSSFPGQAKLPLKSSVSASGSTRRLVAVPKEPVPKLPAGLKSQSAAPKAVSPEFTAVPAVALTSQEELILGSQLEYPQGSLTTPESAASPQDVPVAPEKVSSIQTPPTVEEPSPVIPLREEIIPKMEKEAEHVKDASVPAPVLESELLQASDSQHQATPFPEVEAVQAGSEPLSGAAMESQPVTDGAREDEEQVPPMRHDDQLEQLVSMLEGPGRLLHYADGDEHGKTKPYDDAVHLIGVVTPLPLPVGSEASEIPDIPDD